MNNVIETPNLGPVMISNMAIKYFSKLREDEDLEKAKEDVEHIVQSKEIQRLAVPLLVANRMHTKGENPNAIEFWIHIKSAMVFTVVPKDGYKFISAGMKQSMEIAKLR